MWLRPKHTYPDTVVSYLDGGQPSSRGQHYQRVMVANAEVMTQIPRPTEMAALLSFKSAILNDIHGVLMGWNESVKFAPCSWSGVECNADLHVISLQLSNAGLMGTISPTLGNLSLLQILELLGNTLSGEIPDSLSNLKNLTTLDLYNNDLTGTIPPSLGTLASLEYFDLGYNRLRGGIPISLSNLTKLTHLALSYNMLNGSIPSGFGLLSSLSNLELSSNQLSGGIPPPLSNLTNLGTLGLSNNFLFKNTESIAPILGSLVSLQALYLRGTHLSGTIASQLGTSPLASLTSLVLGQNELFGEVPRSLSNWTALQSLYLDDNSINGRIPPEIGSLRSLSTLSLANNKLVGEIPFSFRNLTMLDFLFLSDNSLTDNIPSYLDSLRVLSLGSNYLTGEIPIALVNQTQLNVLDLSGNQQFGTILCKSICVRPNCSAFPCAVCHFHSLGVVHFRLTQRRKSGITKCKFSSS